MKKLILYLICISAFTLNATLEFRHLKSNVILKLVQGNIVDQKVDTIVNAANKELNGGQGVNGAIQQAAGPGLLESIAKNLNLIISVHDAPLVQCSSLHQHLNSQTGGYTSIIHAVGPVYTDHKPEEADKLLENAYTQSLKAARECGKTIAIPSLSTGIYGFPQDRASKIALSTIVNFLTNCREPLFKEVRLVIYPKDVALYALYKQELEKYVKY